MYHFYILCISPMYFTFRNFSELEALRPILTFVFGLCSVTFTDILDKGNILSDDFFNGT